MRVVITGAEPSVDGARVASRVASELQRQLAAAGHDAVGTRLSLADFEPDPEEGDADMHQAKAPSAVVKALQGADELVHVPFVGDQGGPDAWLDVCGRQTFNLLLAAVEAGLKRVTLLTSMDSYLAYPANAAVSPMWAPLPTTAPSSMAPHLGEFVAKQFARATVGGLTVLIARLGALDEAAHFRTTAGTAAATIIEALEGDDAPTPRWSVIHVHEELTSTDPTPPAPIPTAAASPPAEGAGGPVRVLLLGAKGFLGPHLVTALQEAEGYEVVATDVPGGQLADEPDTTIEWRDVVLQKYGNDEQETLPLDITDAEAVAEAAASVDVVVNCAVTRYSPVMSKLRPSDPLFFRSSKGSLPSDPSSSFVRSVHHHQKHL